MYQTIHEPISVVGVFDHSQFMPKKFRWGKQVILIEQITLISREKDGSVPFFHFSVFARGTVYRLVYYPLEMKWLLEEIWHEGA